MSKHVKFRHKVFFTCLKPFINLFLKIKYHYRGIKAKLNYKQNYLILSNHVTTFDPFAMYISIKTPIYFVVLEDLFNKGFITKIIKYVVAPIRKRKGMNDIGTIKGILEVLNEGGNVGLFIEGNRTFDGRLCTISRSIIKLVKKVKVPIVLYNIEGGYGVDPRWGLKARKGNVSGRVKRVLSHEEVVNMSDDDLYNLIIRELNVNNFPSDKLYKSNKRAEKLERIMYICPICEKESTLSSKNNVLKCSNCGLNVEYTENLMLKANKSTFPFKYIPEWYDYQIERLKKKDLDFDSEEVIYQDSNVILAKNVSEKTVFLAKKATMKITKNKLVISSDDKVFEFVFDEITSMAMQLKTKVIFYYNNESYFIKLLDYQNGIKYVQMYYRIKNDRKGGNNDFFGI